jgi:two-component system cell cycle response regulator
MVLCDVDHFKWINDTHGHPAGDRIVTQVGSFLKHCLRAGDYLCRYGGDEFAMLLPEATLEVAQDVADRLRLEVECRNFEVSQGGERVSITFSVGLATVREGDTAESLIQRVDQAMYKSKQSGRNQTHASAEEGELLTVGV